MALLDGLEDTILRVGPDGAGTLLLAVDVLVTWQVEYYRSASWFQNSLTMRQMGKRDR